MKSTLYIIRGLPGSGKSTLADLLVKNLKDAVKVEVDAFFMSNNGYSEKYKFDRRFLGAAHDECYGRTMRYLRAGTTVCVSNTFTTHREINRYLSGLERTGLSSNVDVKVIKCALTFKSIHNVPQRAIEKMRDRWEDYAGELEYYGDENV